MAEPKRDPALQAIIDEYEANKGRDKGPTVQQGPVDNPLKDPTVQELLREGGFTDEPARDTAPNAGGRAAVNTFTSGLAPDILPFLQKNFEQPLRNYASTVRERAGFSKLPEIEVSTPEGNREQLARDRELHPTASDVGEGLAKGTQMAAGTALAGAGAIPAFAGAGWLPFLGASTAGGLGASVGPNALDVARGDKTSNEAVGDIGKDTALNAAGAVFGPLGKFGPRGHIADALPMPMSPRRQGSELAVNKFISDVAGKPTPVLPKAAEKLVDAGATTTPPGVFEGVGEAVMRPRNALGGTGGAIIAERMAEAAGQGVGMPMVGAIAAGAAAPSAAAAITKIVQNLGARSASEALGLLSNRPDLVLKLAGNPTMYQRAISALLGGEASSNTP